MGLADDIMKEPEKKTEEKKTEQAQPSQGIEFVEVDQIGEDGNPTGQKIKVERKTGLNYHSDFDKYLQDVGKPRKHPPTLQRGVIYDENGKAVGLGGERSSS